MILTLHKIGEVHFDLLGTNAFHVKAKNGRFTAAGSRCCQNLKCEKFASSFRRLRQTTSKNNSPKASCGCSTIISLIQAIIA